MAISAGIPRSIKQRSSFRITGSESIYKCLNGKGLHIVSSEVRVLRTPAPEIVCQSSQELHVRGHDALPILEGHV